MRLGRFRDTVTLKREAAGSRDDNGRWVPGAVTGTPMVVRATEPRMASGPVPAGRAQMAGVGGKRVVAGRVFWLQAATETVRSVIDGQLSGPDVLDWHDQNWIVVSVQEWRTHWQVMTVRRDDPESADAGDVALEDSVMRWVRDGSGATTIPGDDHGPSPAGLYVAVDKIMDRMVGTERTRIVGGIEEVRIDAEATFRVHFYRTGAAACARKLRTWWRSEEGRVTARRGTANYSTTHATHIPFTVEEAGDMVEDPMLVDDDIEDRAYVDVRIAYHQVDRETPREGLATAGVIIKDGTHTETVDIDP